MKMKRIIAILLVAVFVTTVTSIAVSAVRDNFNPTGSWGPISIRNYNTAYIGQFTAGSTAGKADGALDGVNDAKAGATANDGLYAKYHKSAAGIIQAQSLGAIDGWNDGIDSTYSAAYDTAFSNVQSVSPGQPGAPNSFGIRKTPTA
jgi:hypothetical protein